jgi:HK97 family phage major capsid protein
MDLAALRAARKAKIEAMRALLAGATGDSLSAEDQASYDAMKAEVDGMTANIDRLVGQDALEASMAVVVPAAARGQSTVEGGRAALIHAQGDPASREFETFGAFMAAVRFAPNDARLSGLYGESRGGETLAVMDEHGVFSEQRMDTGSSGGFMIPEQFRSTILSIDPASSIVRPRAQVIPAGTPPDAAITIPALDQTGAAPSNVFGGVTVQWIGEGDTKPDTGAQLREVKLEPQEVAGTVTVTDKLLRNWPASSAWIEGLLRGAVGQAEDFAFIRGDGVAKPLGFLNSPAALSIHRTTANLVKYADLTAMVAKILMRGGSPIWAGSQAVLNQVLNMLDDQGRPIYVASPSEGVPNRLLGYPVFWNNRLPGLGTKGDLSIADLNYYLIKDGSGPFVAASEHVLFKQNKTVIKIFWNVDGQGWLTAPYTEENGYTVSPFVLLDVPG